MFFSTSLSLQYCGDFFTHFFFFFPTLLSNFDFSGILVHVILSQHSPVCKLWTARRLLSKQTSSLTSRCDIVFSGYKVPSGLGDRSTHPALRNSSSKSCLLFQEPFKMFSQKKFFFFFKKNFIPNNHEEIEHSKCVQIPCVIKVQSGEREKAGFVSFVLRDRFWARKGILVRKRIIFQLLRSSEAAIPLSNIQFWT